METMYFILGMLSIVAAAFVATIVWGIVKIVKQQKQIQHLHSNIDEQSSTAWRVRDEDIRNQREKETYMERQLSDQFKSINDQITDAVTQCKSYTDSRIDKFTATDKKIIKG